MRPKQWSKNLLLFAGLIFAARGGDAHAWLIALQAFGVFCLLSSATYLINDVVDRRTDRFHPTKKRRPIASGQLRTPLALTASAVLSVVAIAWAVLLSEDFALLAALFWGLMVAYTFRLKREVILDVFAIAAGFVIRALAGAVAVDVPISDWLIICTTLLALFLALAKRRSEIVSLQSSAIAHRKALAHYSIGFIDQMISVVTAATVVSYAFYTIQSDTAEEHEGLILTVPFVLYGIFRYLYLVYRRDLGGAPEQMLLEDRPLLINILLWGALCVWLVTTQ